MRKNRVGIKKLQNLKELLQPRLKVGGLDISDMALTYVRLDPIKNTLQKASVRLPQGCVENGKLLNGMEFRKSVRDLHTAITHKKGSAIPIVLSVSDENVYTQRFSLPQLKPKEFLEAITLNLQTISPIDFNKAYSDWEKIPSKEEDATEQEIRASFAEKKIVDDFTTILKEENFFVTAIEQKAISFVRLLTQFEKTFSIEKSYLFIVANTDGVSFLIVQNGGMYFNRFTSWENILSVAKGKDELEKEFRNFIIRDYHQMNNFFANKFHQQFDAVYVLATNAQYNIAAILQENFSIHVRGVSLRNAALDESWYTALGAGLRGILPLSEDIQISLAPEGTEALYRHMQTSKFMSLWTTIFSSVSFIILVSFLGVCIFLNPHIGNVVAVVTSSFNDPRVLSQYELYTKEASEFNTSVTQAQTTKSRQVFWSKFLSDVYGKAGAGVSIDRLYIQSREMPVTINARATNEQLANDFKGRLAQLPYVTNIDLPLASFQRIDQSSMSFRITFKFNNLNF